MSMTFSPSAAIASLICNRQSINQSIADGRTAVKGGDSMKKGGDRMKKGGDSMKKGGDRSFVGGRKTEENQRSALWKRGGRRRKEPSAAAHSPHSAHLSLNEE